MAGSLGENYFQEVLAVRKGRGRRSDRHQSLCELKVGITDQRQVVLRTLDDSGIAPIVALLDWIFHAKPIADSTEADHRFHGKPITDSTRSRSLIPREADQAKIENVNYMQVC